MGEKKYSNAQEHDKLSFQNVIKKMENDRLVESRKKNYKYMRVQAIL